MRSDRKYRVLCAGALFCVGMIMSFDRVCAQQTPSTAEIIQSLKPKAAQATRALTLAAPQTPPASNAQDKPFIDSLRGRETRKITIEEKQTAAKIAQEKPSIDLEITFDYNSDVIGPRAIPVLENLGAALRSGELKDTVFILGGHTDAAGDPAYNQTLSERRADAVRRFLVETFQVPPQNLIPIGYGLTHLKNPADPLGGENRRVQIVNTEVK